MKEKLQFINRKGLKLSGLFEHPDYGKRRKIAVLAHCFTCGKNLKAASYISKALSDHGHAVFRFDFSGIGDSEGDLSKSTFTGNIEDILDAVAFVEREYGAVNVLLGHSLGGAAVLHAASQLKTLNLVATIASPSEPEHITHMFKDRLSQLQSEGRVNVAINGLEFTVTQEFIDDLHRYPIQDLKRISAYKMIFHSPLDSIVGIEHAQKIYSQLKHPKSFISLDTADHMLSNNLDAEFVGEMIAAFLEKEVLNGNYRLAEKADEGHVVVVNKMEGFKSSVFTGFKPIIADEPESMGGENSGPDPYKLLLSSLGACTAMTLQMYARRKNMKISEIKVDLTHSQNYIDDCKACENGQQFLTRFERNIVIKGDITESERKRLLEIADKCPVHKTLLGKIEIISQLRTI